MSKPYNFIFVIFVDDVYGIFLNPMNAWFMAYSIRMLKFYQLFRSLFSAWKIVEIMCTWKCFGRRKLWKKRAHNTSAYTENGWLIVWRLKRKHIIKITRSQISNMTSYCRWRCHSPMINQRQMIVDLEQYFFLSFSVAPLNKFALKLFLIPMNHILYSMHSADKWMQNQNSKHKN